MKYLKSKTIAAVIAGIMLVGCSDMEDTASPAPEVDEQPDQEAAREKHGNTQPSDKYKIYEENLPEPEPEPESGDKALGETATIGDWTVAVTEVDTDATAEVLSFNEFNEQPSNGIYVLVSVDATYEGDAEGDAWLDLELGLQGADARQYASYDCSAVVEPSFTEEPTVTNGGSVSGKVCFDVPAEALEGDWTVFVEDLFSFTGDGKAHWATGEQV